MIGRQRGRIIEAVRQGRTWAEAAEVAGVKAEALLQYVFDVRQGRRLDFTGFVHRLEAAGREATANSLSVEIAQPYKAPGTRKAIGMGSSPQGLAPKI